MIKRLLLLYALVNAFAYFIVSFIAPAFEADRLAPLLTKSVECLKGQEEILMTVLRESEMENAFRVSVTAAIPWLVLAAATLVHICWSRTPTPSHIGGTKPERACS